MTRIEPMAASQSSSPNTLCGEQLVEEFTQYQYESRAYPRIKLTIEIVARASNGLGTVFGTPFKAVTTDISPAGIGFIHSTAVPDKYLAITLGTNGQQRSVLVEVVRCRAVGDLFEIGAKFMRQLDDV